MAENIIESYLVRIGASTDQKSFGELTSTLKATDNIISKYTANWLENILKFQTVTTSAFASLGSAVIGLADHVASADQDYRLFGMHMYMSQSAARSTKIAMDALGESLDDIVWDPELHERYTALIAMQQHLQAQMGPEYELNMRRIRDLQFEFTKLRVLGMYESGNLVDNLADRLGLGNSQQFLDGLVRKLEVDGPQIVDFFASRLEPVLKDTQVIMQDTGAVASNFGLLLTNALAVLNGDKGLEGTTFSWRKFGDAIEETTHDVAKFLDYILLAEKAFVHFADAGVLFAGGNKQAALKELHAGIADITAETAGLGGSVAGGIIGGMAGTALGAPGGPLGMIAGGTLGTIGGVAGGGALGLIAGGGKEILDPSSPDNPDMAGIHALDRAQRRYDAERSGLLRMLEAPDMTYNLQSLLDEAGSKYSIDPRFLRAVIGQESGGNPYAVSGAGAQGLMQLMPGTARQYGASDPFNPRQNVDAGAKYLDYLLKRYQGDPRSALAAYNEGEGNFDKGYFGANVRDYVNQVMGSYLSMGGSASPVVIHNYGGVHVTVNGTNASAQDIANATMDAIRRKSDMAAQRGAAAYSGPYATNR